MKLDAVVLTKHHLDDWTLTLPEDTYLGYAGIDEDGICRAFGAVYLDGKIARAIVIGTPIPPWAHRYALKVFETLDELGLDVYAECDEEISGAREWMERLGFEPLNDDSGEWKRGAASSDRRRVARHERRRHRQTDEGQQGPSQSAGGG